MRPALFFCTKKVYVVAIHIRLLWFANELQTHLFCTYIITLNLDFINKNRKNPYKNKHLVDFAVALLYNVLGNGIRQQKTHLCPLVRDVLIKIYV